MELILKNEVYAVVGAAIEVHQVLGPGFKEHILKKEYIPDFIFYDKVIVEIKALDRLSGKEESQILNYLKATGYKVGVLINFGGHPKLE